MTLDRGDDFQGFRHASGTDLAAGKIARARTNDNCAVFLDLRDVSLGRGLGPHFGVHRGRDQDPLVGREQRGRSEVVRLPGRHFGDDIGDCRRDDDQIGLARQPDMAHLAFVGERKEVGIDLLARQGGKGERRDEFLRRPSEHAADLDLAFLEAPDEVEAFVGRDAAGDDEEDAFTGEHCVPRSASGREN